MDQPRGRVAEHLDGVRDFLQRPLLMVGPLWTWIVWYVLYITVQALLVVYVLGPLFRYLRTLL